MIKLIVGLGNPGNEYEGTRHNFGRTLVRFFGSEQGAIWQSRMGQSIARLAQGITLLLPETYMNLSGEAVGELARFYKIQPDEILVALDNLNFPLGCYDLRFSENPAGHHGAESVVAHLGTNRCWWLSLGIGRPSRETMTISDYVLSRFNAEELYLVDKVIDAAADLLVDLIDHKPVAQWKNINS